MTDLVPASAVVASARELIGVPFKHQGRSEHGIDCVGLVLLATKRAGCPEIVIPGVTHRPNYGRGVQPNVIDLLERHMAGRLLQPVPGVLVVFQFPMESQPRHHGLMTESGTFVHADQTGPKPMRKVRETSFRAPWTERAPTFWKLPGVSYE